MRVIVAGGAGFVGRYVCAWLERAGHEARVVRRGEPFGEGDAIIHLALFDEPSALAAAEAARDRLLVVASCGDVYLAHDQVYGRERWDGYNDGVPLREDAPLRDANGTERDKRLVERAALAAPRVAILRLPKLYGPGDPAPMYAPWIARWRRGQPAVLGARAAYWRWTHGYVEDIAHAIGLVVTRRAEGVYNVGEAYAPTMRERLRSLLETRIEVVPDDQVPLALAIPITNPVDLVFDTSAIRKEVGYREITPLETGYARTRDAP